MSLMCTALNEPPSRHIRRLVAPEQLHAIRSALIRLHSTKAETETVPLGESETADGTIETSTV